MELVIGFLQQHAPYLLGMVIVQVAIATAGHWATKDRGWDDTWIGACGLAIVFGGPTVALWLAGLDASPAGDALAGCCRRGYSQEIKGY